MNEAASKPNWGGRPREKKNPRLVHLYVEEEAKLALKKLSKKYGLPMSQVFESIILERVEKDNYVLELRKEKEELEKRINELKKENEMLKEKLVKMSERAKTKQTKADEKLEKIKDKIEKIFAQREEIKVVELISILFGIPRGDPSIRTHANKFVTEYFEDQGNYLISQKLGVIIEKDANYQLVGWKVRKL